MEVPLRKTRLNVLSYDDLLVRLHGALQGQDGNALASILGDRYRAVLIDEFQDTDPIQYEIFARVFARGMTIGYLDGPTDAFRRVRQPGTYRARLPQPRTSIRSEPISAPRSCSWRRRMRFFTRTAHLSLVEEIAYRPVRAPKTPRACFAQLLQKIPEPPLQFRLLRGETGTVNRVRLGEEGVGTAVAVDVAPRPKAAGAMLGGQPLRYGDMAVLVRTQRAGSHPAKVAPCERRQERAEDRGERL